MVIASIKFILNLYIFLNVILNLYELTKITLIYFSPEKIQLNENTVIKNN